MRFFCPICRRYLRIPAAYTGKWVQCRRCELLFVAPGNGDGAVSLPPLRRLLWRGLFWNCN